MRRIAPVIAVLTMFTVLMAPVAPAVARAGSGKPATRLSGPPFPQAARPSVAPGAKFVLHAGLAAGAFHRYIYKPFRAGTFNKGAKGRRLALFKAGLAGLFSFHELRLAIRDAQASKTLARLVAPLNGLAARMQGLGTALRHGQLRPADVNQANSQLGAVSTEAARAGSPIKDIKPPANLQPTG